MSSIWKTETTIKTLNCLAGDIALWAQRKGFWQEMSVTGDLTPKVRLLKKCEKIMLVVTELAELVEGLRKPAEPSVAGFTNEEEEVADAMIRLFDYAGYYGLRLGECIAAKMEKNEGRPYQHGKAF